MNFAFPLALLLIVLPLVVRRLMRPLHSEISAMRVPPSIAQIGQSITGSEDHSRQNSFLLMTAFCLIVIALAGPQRLRESNALPIAGRDIFLALDMSGSMEKEDFVFGDETLSRLEAVKRVSSEFVKSRTGDRVGLTLFGDRAYIAAPLTHDLNAVVHAIDEAVIGISGKSTAISDGLGLSLKRLHNSVTKSRVVVLLSDGVDTTGTVNPEDAAALAKQLGIRIHTIALGPKDTESDPNARDAVDAITLALIATASGGQHFRVKNTRELQEVIQTIDKLEPTPKLVAPILYMQAYWIWPAGLALLILGWILIQRWMRL